MWDKLWINARIATCQSHSNSFLENAAIATSGNKITWLADQSTLPQAEKKLAKQIIDVKNRWITPGLIDCHTHLIYAGNRAHEFAERLQGKSYAEIANAGGGILATMKATRQASFDELYQLSKQRLINLMSEGVTTVEIKSGYGLDLETETKMLKVAQALEDELPVTICKTFLGAHTLPPEFDNKDDYIAYVCNTIIPSITQEKLADAVDVFCETIAFSPQQTEQVFLAAKKAGLAIKIHAEQLSNQHGATLASQYQALSADHLEHISEESIIAMARAGTIAVLLPGAFYYLQEKQQPPIHLLRKHQVPIAIATDSNPGSSPTNSLLLMLNMACVLFHLTPEEALLAVTKNAAKALGLQESLGTLAVGKNADFVVWNIDHPRDLSYQFGTNPRKEIIKNGKPITV